MKPETCKTTVCPECGGSGLGRDMFLRLSATERCGKCDGTGRILAGKENDAE